MRQLTAALALLTFIISCTSGGKRELPIYGNRQAVTKTVDGKTVTDTLYQTIPPFKYLDQYNASITNQDVSGKIYVADFFFTSCPSICPVMQRNMLTVYNAFKGDPNFKILSFTIDPKYDSVPVLKKYADKLGVSGNAWWFLQGNKEDTYRLAEKSFLVAVNADSTVPGGYVHQGYFVLVDKLGRVRGSYDGTNPQQVAQLVDDIKLLKEEPASSSR